MSGIPPRSTGTRKLRLYISNGEEWNNDNYRGTYYMKIELEM